MGGKAGKKGTRYGKRVGKREREIERHGPKLPLGKGVQWRASSMSLHPCGRVHAVGTRVNWTVLRLVFVPFAFVPLAEQAIPPSRRGGPAALLAIGRLGSSAQRKGRLPLA